MKNELPIDSTQSKTMQPVPDPLHQASRSQTHFARNLCIS